LKEIIAPLVPKRRIKLLHELQMAMGPGMGAQAVTQIAKSLKTDIDQALNNGVRPPFRDQRLDYLGWWKRSCRGARAMLQRFIGPCC
jgi:hypothetical protein